MNFIFIKIICHVFLVSLITYMNFALLLEIYEKFSKNVLFLLHLTNSVINWIINIKFY